MALSSFSLPELRRRAAVALFSSPLLPSTAAGASGGGVRILRRHLHEGPDTVEELLDRHLGKDRRSSVHEDDDEIAARRRLTSTRREVLGLYRDILRATRFFTWPDARGVPWREVLRANARKEFEEARFERDPEIVTKLLIGGQEAVQQALDKLAEAAKKMAEAENQNHGGGR